jgi:hypothetical protein
MIFHASIQAENPERVGRALAELWRGEVHPFPPIGVGSVIVMAGDERNSAIEIYALGTDLHEAAGDADGEGRPGGPDGRRAAHLAIATPLSRGEVEAIAGREGWSAKYRKRGGMFGVLEVWLENAFMLEVLTPSMQTEYLQSFTPQSWRAVLAEGPA